MNRLVPLIIVLAFVAATCGDDDTTGTPDVTTTQVAAATPDPTDTSAATTTSIVAATPDPTDTSAATTTSVVAATPGTSDVTTTQPSAPTEISITTADGLVLEATVYPGGPNWVVLAHMRPADKTSWTELASLFQDEGYTVLAYNNRGYGGSDGDRESFALRIDADAALEYVRAQGAGGIVFGGASMNGATAMTLGASYDFERIFVLSAVPSFPSVADATDFLADISEPILFVAAEDDGTAAEDARAYVDLAQDPHEIVLEAGGHGTSMLLTNPDLGRRIVQWVQEATNG